MTDLPDMRVKALVSFPAVVNGGTGISVSKVGGAYTFDVDYNEIALVNSIPAPSRATTSLLLFESVQGTYFRMTLADFKTLLASMP